MTTAVTVTATVTAAMRTTVRAAGNGIVRNVTQAVQVVVNDGIREDRMVVVTADAVMTQRIQVVVPQAVQVVMAQRIARVNVRAVTALGSSQSTGRSGQFVRRKSFLLAGVGDERKYCDKKQGLFHEKVSRMM